MITKRFGIFGVLLLIFLSSGTLAQIGFGTSIVKYSGERGKFYKNDIAFELRIHNDFKHKTGFGVYLSYHNLQAKRDKYPSYYISKENENVVFEPGFYEFPQYHVISFGTGTEILFLNGKINPFIGVDIIGNYIAMSFSKFSETYKSYMAGGINARIGIIFQPIYEFDIVLELGRCHVRNSYREYTPYWKPTFFVVYQF